MKAERFCAGLSRRDLLGMLLSSVSTVRGDARPRSIAGPPAAHSDFSSTVERVVLDVSVKNSEGGYVTGLGRDSFQIFENGRRQPILNFYHADAPVTVGLVIDNSGSMRTKRPSVVTAGLAFAKESNPKDEFFVVNFNNHVSPGLPPGVAFSDDLRTLRAALYMGAPQGQTALYDAIVFGLNHLKRGRETKKTLIVVSDGGDNVSHARLRDVSDLVRASQATIYTVGLFTDNEPDQNSGVLQKLARLSGGEYFHPLDPKDVVPTFHKIARDLRNRYTLVYAPDPALDRKTSPDRTIRVVASAKGFKKLIVRARTHYSFRPPDRLLSADAE